MLCQVTSSPLCFWWELVSQCIAFKFILKKAKQKTSSFIPNNKCDSNMLMLRGEKSKLLDGCDSLSEEYSFMENSNMDSCKISSPVRLCGAMQGSHATANSPHEWGTGVGGTERKQSKGLKMYGSAWKNLLFIRIPLHGFKMNSHLIYLTKIYT